MGRRRVLQSVLLAGALAAAVLGARHTWPNLSSQRAHLTAAEAERASAKNEGLPVDRFDAMRSRVKRGDRWWLQMPSGSLDEERALYRTYALYWLLPAVPAPSRERATDVFDVAGTP